jgi:hypothetical protein
MPSHAPPSIDPAHPPGGSLSIGAKALRVALVFGIALLSCVIGYLIATVPDAWFPVVDMQSWRAKDLVVMRGSGRLVGDELVITAPDATGTTIISLNAQFRSSQYPTIAWIGADFPEHAKVTMLWKSDYLPDKVNVAPVAVEAGRLRPVQVLGTRRWVGNVTGLALTVQGPLPAPLRIRGVVAKPMGVFGTLRDRAGEWLAFESWTGTSINNVVGGADVQDLPLPLFLAAAAALASALAYILARWQPRVLGVGVASAIAGSFLFAWFALDARWTWNLTRQVAETGARYGGKDTRETGLAAEDGALYAFIEKARAVMPQAPARIFVIADTPYFRGRAAYHLYPHNAYADVLGAAPPPATAMRPGDWVLVWQRPGIQYDPAQRKLRWDARESVSAQATLVGEGAALFVVR